MEMQMYKQASLHVGWEKLLNNIWMHGIFAQINQKSGRGKRTKKMFLVLTPKEWAKFSLYALDKY